MSGRSSRQKGSRGELSFRDLLRSFGFQAERTGRGYNAPKDDIAHNVEGVHFEVKSQEVWTLPKWIRQAEEDAGDRVAIVVFRKKKSGWRLDMPAEFGLELLKMKESLTDAGVIAYLASQREKGRPKADPSSPSADSLAE